MYDSDFEGCSGQTSFVGGLIYFNDWVREPTFWNKLIRPSAHETLLGVSWADEFTFHLFCWEPKLDKIRWSGQSEKESLIIFPSAILNTKIWRNYVEYEFVFFFGCSRTQSLELCEIGRRTKGSEENRREVVFRFLWFFLCFFKTISLYSIKYCICIQMNEINSYALCPSADHLEICQEQKAMLELCLYYGKSRKKQTTKS